MNNHNTVLLNWNASGIKITETSLLAFLLSTIISIFICTTKTHLLKIDNIILFGYNMYRADRIKSLQATSGVAILIGNKIKHQHIIPVDDLQCLEVNTLILYKSIYFIRQYLSTAKSHNVYH